MQGAPRFSEKTQSVRSLSSSRSNHADKTAYAVFVFLRLRCQASNMRGSLKDRSAPRGPARKLRATDHSSAAALGARVRDSGHGAHRQTTLPSTANMCKRARKCARRKLQCCAAVREAAEQARRAGLRLRCELRRCVPVAAARSGARFLAARAPRELQQHGCERAARAARRRHRRCRSPPTAAIAALRPLRWRSRPCSPTWCGSGVEPHAARVNTRLQVGIRRHDHESARRDATAC